MGKLTAVILTASVFLLGLSGIVCAQETGREAAKTGLAVKKAPQGPAAARPIRPGFSLVSGTIKDIDKTDTANIKVEVKSDVENKTDTVYVTPWTNITKLTDISELKAGDNVRIMSKEIDNKRTALSIMFGNIKNIPTARPINKAVPAQKPAGAATGAAAKK